MVEKGKGYVGGSRCCGGEMWKIHPGVEILEVRWWRVVI